MFSFLNHPVLAIISALVAIGVLMLFALVVVAGCVLIYRVVRGRTTLQSLGNVAAKVNVLDGVDQEEWEIIQTELLKQKRSEKEEQVKAKLAKVSGYEVEA